MYPAFLRENKDVFKNLDKIILAGIGLLILLYALSGIYVIQANQAGVLLRFGSYQKTVGPGMHYRLPWPMDQVKKVKIMEVKTMDLGFLSSKRIELNNYDSMAYYCLTGDQNIIHAGFSIQYRISDPAKFLFKSRKPEKILQSQANSAILATIAQTGVDPLLTTGKRQLEMEIKKSLIKAVDEIGLGLTIVGIETKQIQPPKQVQAAFKDVIDAREEKSTAIHGANNYRNKVIPKAKANAKAMSEKALGQGFRKVKAAYGESARFSHLFQQYRLAPKVTKDRLFLELVDEVLPRVKVYIMAINSKGQPVKLKLVKQTGSLGLPQAPKKTKTPESRRKAYLEARPGLSAKVATAISEGRILKGMSKEQVKASLGEPLDLAILENNPAGDERWDYDQDFIFFKSGVVESWISEF